MAEGLLQGKLGEESGIAVKSAGVAASNGSPASIETRNILLKKGIDFTDFRSQQLTTDLMDEADYVFCMSQMHRNAILSSHPEYREKALLLGEFLGEEKASDIFDPYGMGKEAYLEVEKQVSASLDRILAFISENKQIKENLDL